MQKENKKGVLYKLFESIPPSELSKLMEKRQDNSTRDKKVILKKVSEIEDLLVKINIEISIKKSE